MTPDHFDAKAETLLVYILDGPIQEGEPDLLEKFAQALRDAHQAGYRRGALDASGAILADLEELSKRSYTVEGAISELKKMLLKHGTCP